MKSMAEITLPPNFMQPGKILSLSENYSSAEDMINYAVLTRSGNQVGDWMRCKDYIQDIVWGSINKVGYRIYGWTFKYPDDKIDPNHLMLAMRWCSKRGEDFENIRDNISSTLFNLESVLGIPLANRTKFSQTLELKARGEEYCYFVVYVSKYWLRCIGTVSFLTWLLRASALNVGKTWKSLLENKKSFPVPSDQYYLNDGRKFIDHIMENGIEVFVPDWDRSTVNHVHNNGWVNYSHHIKKKSPQSTLYGNGGGPTSSFDDDDGGDEWDENDDW